MKLTKENFEDRTIQDNKKILEELEAYVESNPEVWRKSSGSYAHSVVDITDFASTVPRVDWTEFCRHVEVARVGTRMVGTVNGGWSYSILLLKHTMGNI